MKIAAVATGFPSGQYPLEVRLDDARQALAAGADEIDMVINRGAFLSGRLDEVAGEIREIKAACGFAPLKIILETGELETYDAIRRASDLAIEGLVLALLARLVRSTSWVRASAGQGTGATRLERAREFIDAHFSRPLLLTEIASVAGLHPSSLARAFKRRMGVLVVAAIEDIGTSAESIDPVLALAARAALAGVVIVGRVDAEAPLAHALVRAADRHRLFVMVPDAANGRGAT